MKLKLISDTHFESHRDKGKSFIKSVPNEGVDVLVLPGDISTRDHIDDALMMFCDRFEHVVYTSGNHQAWWGDMESAQDQLKEIDSKISNLHYLENNTWEHDGQRFIGGTLWFDHNKLRYPDQYWSDYQFIKDGRWGINDAHKRTRAYLEESVQKGDIVVTHHMPSSSCAHPRWLGNPCNGYFYSNMNHVIANQEPAFWFFGHTHDPRSMMLSATKCVCNPYGYPNEYNKYDENLIIDISKKI